MPRSPDGGYSLPPGTLVSSGDTLLPTQHNPAMQDIAAALGNSLDRNGAGGMRAPLDMGGNAIRNAQPGALPTDLATVGQAGIPVGALLPFAGAVAPDGFALCYGQALSRADYAALFAVIGTSYGAGNGTTTFNAPDMRGNVAAGRDDMGGASASRLTGGASLGAQVGSQSVTLTEAQLAPHSHPVNDPGHIHSLGNQIASGGASIGVGSPYNIVSGSTTPATTGISIGQGGGGQAHPNVQPSLVVNYIIKASL